MSRVAKLFLGNIHFPILLGIILLGIWLRLIGWNPNSILDFDPWWFFRHAQEILGNGFAPPKWDILSYYPPGRPVDYYLGWSYTIAAFYAITSSFVSITLTKFAGLFVAIFAGLSAIPAYLVGKHVTNRWGGLATAFFATISITFISVSIAGYPDSDATDVFYSFLSIITTLFAIKKADKMDFSNRAHFFKSLVRYLPYVAPAVASYWLFAINWSSSWYIYFIFVAFIPLLIIFRIVESLIKREHKFGLRMFVTKIRENRNLIFAILLIGFIGEAVSMMTSGWPTNTIPPHDQLIQGLNTIGTKGLTVVGFVAVFGIIGSIAGVAFGRLTATVIGGLLGLVFAIFLALAGITGQSLIVNQSVAELQPIQNIFEQFGTIVGRIGAVPLFFAFAAFFITFLKLVFKKEIHLAEYFAIIWLIVSLFLITKGIRFSLLFSIAAATAAGFTIGNLISYARARGSAVLLGAFFAVFIIGGVLHFNDNYGFSKSAQGGLDVSQNWRDALGWLKDNADKDSLVTTWWDPGHIITGSTGLKVMADGAHCGPNSCIFLDHNSRIQDMGRAFAISDESEAVKILSKYLSITPEQCQDLKKRFPSQFTPDSCKPVTEMYILATSDLIGKYYWLNFFGTGQGAVYTSCNFHNGETDRLGAPTYVCASSISTEISLVQQGNNVFAVMNSPQQGVRNVPVEDVLLFQQGAPVVIKSGANVTNPIRGLVWVEPSFGSVLFMSPGIRDSIFTNMFFFNGGGEKGLGIKPLEKFKLVYDNPEVKIYKVDFTNVI